MRAADDLMNDLDDPHKRVQAILSLGEIGHLPALDRILSFASDPDPQVRRAVMGALAAFDDDRALAVIIALRGDPDAGVRAAADQTWATWLLKRMLQLSGAERGYVMLKNPATGAMEYQAGEQISAEQVTKPEFAVNQQVIAEAAQTGAPILTDNASRDSRFSGSEGIVGFSLRQLIAIPLKSGDEVVGVVYCDKRFARGLLNPAELQTLSEFADQAAQAARPTPLPMAPPPAPIIAPPEEGMAAEREESAPMPLPSQDGTPDYDPMTPEEIMKWMENLARRQGASEEFMFSPSAEMAEIDPTNVAKPDAPDTSGAIVNFSAYHPAEAVADTPHGLYVYAHLAELAPAVEGDVGQFRDQLGGSVPAPRVAKQTARLQPGTLITMTPECDDLEFEPVAVTKKWNGQWTRFDFAFQPGANMAGDSLFVRVSVAVSGVEIAQIKCPITVVAQPSVQPDNPLRAAKLTAQTVTMYQRIFISYSRKDKPVAEAYRRAQMALGNEIFMDSYSIRVGDDWRAALARAIDDADIFQLFWSSAAAESENVRDEWDYALKYRCPDQTCATFIRPVFWATPMPPPPDALAHLNFRFVPLYTAGSQG